MRPERLRLPLAGLLAAALVFVVGACTTDPVSPVDSPATPGTTERPQPGMPVPVVDLAVDELPVGDLAAGTPVPNPATPNLPALAVYPDAPSPSLEVVPTADATRAIRFPGPCDQGPDCRRGILEVGHAPALNPDRADFAFGAAVRLKVNDIRDGANLLQKGYSTGGTSQWKLQVDDREGRPGCVLTGVDGRVQQVLAKASIADGFWHEVSCSRTDRVLVISVDGTAAEAPPVTAPIQITNTLPMRIGGKHTKENADAFFGDLARVWYSITPAP